MFIRFYLLVKLEDEKDANIQIKIRMRNELYKNIINYYFARRNCIMNSFQIVIIYIKIIVKCREKTLIQASYFVYSYNRE